MYTGAPRRASSVVAYLQCAVSGLLYIGQGLVVGGWWQFAVGGWWQLAVGGWRLVAVGGWQLAVGGGWRLAVGGWWSLGAVLKGCPWQKKILAS